MLAPPRDAAQRAATGRLGRAMYPQLLKPDQAAKLCVPLANKYGVPAPSRQLVDIVKARTSNHTLPLAACSSMGDRRTRISPGLPEVRPAMDDVLSKVLGLRIFECNVDLQ